MARSHCRFGVILLLFGASLALTGSHAQAQSSGATSTPADQGGPDTQANQAVPTFFVTVVETASREKALTREVPSNVTILGPDVIKASNAQTLSELLVEQGFNSAHTDVAGVQIRGFGQLLGPPEHTNTVLTLLDGRRTGNANLTLIGLQNVERIEIIRGPSAVQYGSSAMGGVINIITRRGAAEPTASFEAGFGSDTLMRQKLAFSGVARGFDLSVGVTNHRRDDLTAAGGRRWHHTAIDHNTNVSADAGYSFNAGHRARVSFNFGEIESELPGSGIRPYDLNTAGASYTDYRTKTNSTALSYAGNTANKAWDWAGSYSFGVYRQQPYPNDLDTTFVNAQGGYNSLRFSASFGFDHYEYASTPSNWATRDAGLYGTGKVRLLAERLVVSAGFRFDSYTNESRVMAEAKDDHAGGSFGAAYMARPWLKLRANYASGFKVPAPEQVAGDGSFFYLPNLSLEPEASKTFEFGGDADWKYLQAAATWFHSDWDDKILGVFVGGDCAGGFGCYRYQNLKSSTLAGLEGSVSTDLGRASGWNVRLAPYVTFTWLHTRRNNDPSQFIPYDGTLIDTLPNTPDWMVSYGVGYMHQRLDLSGRLNAAYYGDVLTQDWSIVDYVTVFTAPHIHRPAGTVVNLSVEKGILALASQHHRLRIRAEVTNLFDGANEMYWSYPGPGRSVYAGVRYEY